MLEEFDEGELAGLAKEIEGSQDLLDVANKAPIIKLVNMILFQALKMRASRRPHPALRGRAPGAVPHRRHPLRHDAAAQEAAGRASLAHQDHGRARHRRAPPARRTAASDVQAAATATSTSASPRVPTIYGERVVMRLLDKSARSCSTSPSSGLTATTLDDVQAADRRARTASSSSPARPAAARRRRSTRALKHDQRDRQEHHHVEDPVEYQLPGHQPDRRCNAKIG